MNATHMILVSKDLPSYKVNEMLSDLEEVGGVKWALGLQSIVGPMIPDSMIPDSVKEVLENDTWRLILCNSQYKVATEDMTTQCNEINEILDRYDEKAMLVGEAPCTEDLITITDKDFKVVSIISIGVIFLIIGVIFKSISLPILLVAVIEFAIFINMGIPYYTKTEIPFIASIVIGTIQLGATVDYAILMTTRYKKERSSGHDKMESIQIAHGASIKSVISSALSFFAATFGVGLYSKIDMISALCSLMARGAIVSMFVVLFILPAIFMIFDKVIVKTSVGFKPQLSK